MKGQSKRRTILYVRIIEYGCTYDYREKKDKKKETIYLHF